MMNLRELFFENPMLIEVRRVRRRFFDSGRGTAVNRLTLAVAAIAYLVLLLVVFNFSGDIPPSVLVYLQTAIFSLLAPALLHGSIAGEREKRSWDLLLVAPISHSQIVVGKFMAALVGLIAGWALFLFPTVIAAITYNPIGTGEENFGAALVFQELVSISFGVLCCSIAMFLSARSRRAFAALGSGLGVLFVLLMGSVMVGSIGGLSYSPLSGLALFFNPFWVIGQILTDPNPYNVMPDAMLGVPQTLTYLAISAVLIVWAYHTLTFADGEKRFIGGKRVA